MSGTIVKYACKSETRGPFGCDSLASLGKQSCASRWISANAGTFSRSPSCAYSPSIRFALLSVKCAHTW